MPESKEMLGRRKGRLGEVGVRGVRSEVRESGRRKDRGAREASGLGSGWHGEAGNGSRAGSQVCRQVWEEPHHYTTEQ